MNWLKYLVVCATYVFPAVRGCGEFLAGVFVSAIITTTVKKGNPYPFLNISLPLDRIEIRDEKDCKIP